MNDQETQAVFVALADPTRRWVIERLTRIETTTASVLADQLPITRQAISKHFKVLDEAGLVSCQQVAIRSLPRHFKSSDMTAANVKIAAAQMLVEGGAAALAVASESTFTLTCWT